MAVGGQRQGRKDAYGGPSAPRWAGIGIGSDPAGGVESLGERPADGGERSAGVGFGGGCVLVMLFGLGARPDVCFARSIRVRLVWIA
nr:unnamed protein product [Digitaria exilis]